MAGRRKGSSQVNLKRWAIFLTLALLSLVSVYRQNFLFQSEPSKVDLRPAPQVQPPDSVIRASPPQVKPSRRIAPVTTTTAARPRSTRSPPQWEECAPQWQTCTCAGPVRWGNGDTWKVIPITNGELEQSVDCNFDKLGDILPGDDRKHCECQAVNEVDESSSDSIWLFCAGQWQDCHCEGTIRWGNNGRWRKYKVLGTETSRTLRCDIQSLPDVAPGDDAKHCECLATPGTEFFERINPGLHPVGTSFQTPVGSCEIFEADKENGDHGAQLWEAVMPFCAEAWEPEASIQIGDRPISRAKQQSLMRIWVEPRYQENYDRIYQDGWVDRAFVNYYMGLAGGKHANMTRELIRSVHEFSKAAVIVVNFGFSTDPGWDVTEFPRLVVFNAEPLPPQAQRSFNFNKFRAMILTRIRVGIQLDSDQFVAPGVDVLFDRTSVEVTRDYPFPILPAHFLDWGPQGEGPGGVGHKLWDRYCPEMRDGICKWQTARWGHAHPTWTFWALPFLGRWLGKNFRDEWLPEGKNGQKALRVIDVKEDEDLLNVGTWEDGGTKQWCKFDIPDPTEFEVMVAGTKQPTSKNGRRKCQYGKHCGNIVKDRYNPAGIAKLFYTAHHAVFPNQTLKYIRELSNLAQRGELPPPVLYMGEFFSGSADLRKAYPDLRCLA